MRPLLSEGCGRELSTPKEVERRAREGIREFAEALSKSDLATIDAFTLEPEHRAGAGGEEGVGGRIRAKTQAQGDCVVLHVDTDGLVGIPELVLQGWLEFEMVLSTHNRQCKPAWFNFKKQILPLIAASGSAAYFMRELLEYLSVSLKNHWATNALIEMGRGVPQVHFRHFLMMEQSDPRDAYAATLFHDWVRALNLCKKARNYVPLELLAESEIEAAEELRTLWRQRHDLLSEDQRLLTELSAILRSATGGDRSSQLVEMFVLVRDALLWRRGPREALGAVH